MFETRMPVFALLMALLMRAIATANMAAPAFPETRIQRLLLVDYAAPDN